MGAAWSSGTLRRGVHDRLTNVAHRVGRGFPAGRRRPPDPAGGPHVRRARRRCARSDRRVRVAAPRPDDPVPGRRRRPSGRGAGRGRGRAPAPGHAGARRHRRPVVASPPRADSPRPTRAAGRALDRRRRLRRGTAPRRRGVARGRPRTRWRAAPHRRQPGARSARCHDRPLLGRRRRQDGVALRRVVRAGRRGAGGFAPDRRARRGPRGTVGCSSTSTTCTTSAARPMPWANRPGSTPTTSCRPCRPPTWSCPSTRCGRA